MHVTSFTQLTYDSMRQMTHMYTFGNVSIFSGSADKISINQLEYLLKVRLSVISILTDACFYVLFIQYLWDQCNFHFRLIWFTTETPLQNASNISVFFHYLYFKLKLLFGKNWKNVFLTCYKGGLRYREIKNNFLKVVQVVWVLVWSRAFHMPSNFQPCIVEGDTGHICVGCNNSQWVPVNFCKSACDAKVLSNGYSLK